MGCSSSGDVHTRRTLLTNFMSSIFCIVVVSATFTRTVFIQRLVPAI